MLRLVVGNTKPELVVRVLRDGDAVDLTGCTVELRIEKPNGAVTTKALAITDAEAGVAVLSEFTPGDIDQPGRMFGEIAVTFEDGNVQNAQEPVEVIVRAEHAEAVE